jgi:RimJ/RimL family protein N-acetyltransferase
MTDPDFLQVPPMRVVETERLRLRTVRMSDAAALMPIVTDETTMKYTSGLIANDIDAVTRWLSARALGKDVLNFVITLKDNGPPEEGGRVVGIMGSYHWPEIGYLMNPGMFLCKHSKPLVLL